MKFESSSTAVASNAAVEALDRAFLDAPLPEMSEENLETAKLLGKEGKEARTWWERAIAENRKMLASEWSPTGYQTDALNIMSHKVTMIERARQGGTFDARPLASFEEFISSRSVLEQEYLRARTGSERIAALDALIDAYNQSQESLAASSNWDGLMVHLRGIYSLIKGSQATF